MKIAARRTSTAFAAVAAAGVSSLFLGVSPASAATAECGTDGTLIAPGICEQTFTSGTASFTPTPQMTKLEVLLVGAGGAGADQPVPNSNGYAAGGGGGEVKIVDFSGATAAMNVIVPAPGIDGSVKNGTIDATVRNGISAGANGEQGGQSGNGNLGSPATGVAGGYGGGGGTGASPTSRENGGAGVIVNTLLTTLFSNDTTCYGGGGAIGTTSVTPTVQGLPGCGGGGPTDATATALSAPRPNSGGGGGGLNVTQSPEMRAGASGVIVIRWTSTITVSFDANGHGTAPAAQDIGSGSAPARPTDPTAEGYEFRGWYTDSALSTLADFTAPFTSSTTLYASWAVVLPATGGMPNQAQLPIGLAALLAGAGLVAVAQRRKRQAD